MKRLFYFLIISTFLMVGCNRTGTFETVTENIPVNPVTLVELAVVGFVKDVSGNPLADVEVKIGKVTVKTDAIGLYHFEKVSMSTSGTIIKASKPGFETEIINVKPNNQPIIQIDFNLKRSLSAVTIVKPNFTLLQGKNFTLNVNLNALLKTDAQSEIQVSLETRSTSNDALPILLPAAIGPKNNQDVDISEQFEFKIRNLKSSIIKNTDTVHHVLKLTAKDKILYKLDYLRGIWIVEKPASGNADYKIFNDQIYGIGNFTTRVPIKAKVINNDKLPVANTMYQIKNTKGNILVTGITDGEGNILERLPKDEEFFIEVKGGCSQSFQKIASGKPTGLLVDLGSILFSGATGIQLTFKNCDGSQIFTKAPFVIEVKQGKSINKIATNTSFVKSLINLCPGTGLIEISVKNGEKKEGYFQIPEDQIKNGQLILQDLNLCGKEEFYATLEIDKKIIVYKGDDYKILKQNASDLGITDFGDLTIIISNVKDKGMHKVFQFAYLKPPRVECKENCHSLKAEVIRFGNLGQVIELKISGSIDGKNIIGYFKNIRFS